jgi:adenylate cyclase
MVQCLEMSGVSACGDAVNVAARLETVNKQFGTHICVSATTADASTTACIDAYEKMRGADPAASQAFAAHVDEYDDDTLAMYHLCRLLASEPGACIELSEA